MQNLRIEMIEVQEDVIGLLADAAAFANLDRHRARDDIARREIFRVRRVALHEALALRIRQITAFAARAFRDQHARAVDARRMKLHELHVLQRQARPQNHGVAVARAGMRRRAGKIRAPVSAGRENGFLRAEPVQRTVIEIERDDAAARPVLIHDEIEREIFDEELSRVA